MASLDSFIILFLFLFAQLAVGACILVFIARLVSGDIYDETPRFGSINEKSPLAHDSL